MTENQSNPRTFTAGKLTVEIYPTEKAMGDAAAHAAALALLEAGRSDSQIGVIFATGASQLETLHALSSVPGLPWERIVGFHMDEYVGLSPDHPASFRRYLRENLASRVSMREFREIDGTAPDLHRTIREYADRLRRLSPRLCLLGIGENGHLAFNDPGVADFRDPVDMKIVTLDAVCREQQWKEGWFGSTAEVPPQAVTLTIPTLLRVPRLIASVPGIRKAAIVRRALEAPISTACPATILRTHPNTTLYLDEESASELHRTY